MHHFVHSANQPTTEEKDPTVISGPDVAIICDVGSMSQCVLGELDAVLSKVPSLWKRWTHSGICLPKHFNDFLAACGFSS